MNLLDFSVSTKQTFGIKYIDLDHREFFFRRLLASRRLSSPITSRSSDHAFEGEHSKCRCFGLTVSSYLPRVVHKDQPSLAYNFGVKCQ